MSKCSGHYTTGLLMASTLNNESKRKKILAIQSAPAYKIYLYIRLRIHPVTMTANIITPNTLRIIKTLKTTVMVTSRLSPTLVSGSDRTADLLNTERKKQLKKIPDDSLRNGPSILTDRGRGGGGKATVNTYYIWLAWLLLLSCFSRRISSSSCRHSHTRVHHFHTLYYHLYIPVRMCSMVYRFLLYKWRKDGTYVSHTVHDVHPGI